MPSGTVRPRNDGQASQMRASSVAKATRLHAARQAAHDVANTARMLAETAARLKPAGGLSAQERMGALRERVRQRQQDAAAGTVRR